jgi:methyl-accepting chemotaxis protein
MINKKMTIRARLVLAFGGLAVLISISALTAIHALGNTKTSFSNYIDGINARLILTYELRTAVDRRAIGILELLNAQTPQEHASNQEMISLAQIDVKNRMAALLKAIAAPGVSDEARHLVGEIEKVELRYATVAAAIVESAFNGNHGNIAAMVRNDFNPLLADFNRAAHAYRDFTLHLSNRLIKESEEHYVQQRNILIACCFLAFVAAATACFLMPRNLKIALGAEPNELGALGQKMAMGDLSPLPTAASAQPDSVLASLSSMQKNLVHIVSQVRAASESIANGSSQISKGNAELSQRTEEQATAVQQTATTMEQFGATVRNNADNAKIASQLAVKASGVAIQGGTVVAQVVNTMKGINDSSQKIGDIIGVINSIAFQTNILALNAAVEAARAGDLGLGFAVVASEVRSLAIRSAEAAKEIKSLIVASLEQVEQGTHLVNQAGQTMTEVVSAIQRVSDIVGEISAANAEQSSGVTQIGLAINQLDLATQQNAALVEESAAAAQNLENQAVQLVEVVSVFKIEGYPALPAPDPALFIQGPSVQRPTSSLLQGGRAGVTKTTVVRKHAAVAVTGTAAPANEVKKKAADPLNAVAAVIHRTT